MNILKKKKILIIGMVFIIISLFFLALSLISDNNEFTYYNFTILAGFVVFVIFYDRIHLEISMLVGLLAIGLLHLAGGNLTIDGTILYQTSFYNIPYDKIVHFFASFVITLIAYNFIEETLSKKDRRRTFLVGFIILMIGVGLGTIVEIIEYLSTIIFKETIVGDYINNASDLVANLLGVILALVFSLTHFKKGKQLSTK